MNKLTQVGWDAIILVQSAQPDDFDKCKYNVRGFLTLKHDITHTAWQAIKIN